MGSASNPERMSLLREQGVGEGIGLDWIGIVNSCGMDTHVKEVNRQSDGCESMRERERERETGHVELLL